MERKLNKKEIDKLMKAKKKLLDNKEIIKK